MNNLINILADKLSRIEDKNDNVILSDEEINVNDAVFFVKGIIYYSNTSNNGDYFTPSTANRKFLDANLEVVVFIDKNDDEGRFLTTNELDLLIKELK